MSIRTPVLVLAVWAALLVGSLALVLLAAANDTLPGDRAITEWLQEQRLPGQGISDFVRAVTATEVVLATGAAVSLILWLGGYRRQSILLGAGLAGMAMAQFGVKELVERPRPDDDLVDVRAGGSSPSFPAGHVMSGTFLYGFITYLALTSPLDRRAAVALAIAAALVIALVGPVNVWQGVHWPSDVLGGYLLVGVILLPLIAIDLRQRTQFVGQFP
jgi:membrane-associated phospholipid phosphatase